MEANVRKIRRTDRSRPIAAIKQLALSMDGRILSQKATYMLEDIMNHVCKEIMRAAALLCPGSQNTITEPIAVSAFMLVFRNAKFKGSGSKNVMTAGRVGTMLRRYMMHPCDRLSQRAIVYSTENIESYIVYLIRTASEHAGCRTVRIKTRDIMYALSIKTI